MKLALQPEDRDVLQAAVRHRVEVLKLLSRGWDPDEARPDEEQLRRELLAARTILAQLPSAAIECERGELEIVLTSVRQIARDAMGFQGAFAPVRRAAGQPRRRSYEDARLDTIATVDRLLDRMTTS